MLQSFTIYLRSISANERYSPRDCYDMKGRLKPIDWSELIHMVWFLDKNEKPLLEKYKGYWN